jgi:hypothetical protein
MARVSFKDLGRGRLVWPSGEFKLDPWSTKEVLEFLKEILLLIVFFATGGLPIFFLLCF